MIARRLGDKNPNSSVVAETMKQLANSSNGYQTMDRSRHIVTKSSNDEKTHSAINSKIFKRLNNIIDQLYEAELVKLEIEHREAIIVGFFILKYAKQRILELCYNFFKKFCDADKFEELEMDTSSLYLSLLEEIFINVFLPKKGDNWNAMRSGDCTENFSANATDNFFRRLCCNTHKKHKKREPGIFKEKFKCAETLCLCS